MRWHEFWKLLADNPECHVIRYCCIKLYNVSEVSVRTLSKLIEHVANDLQSSADDVRRLQLRAFATLLLPMFREFVAADPDWHPPVGTPILNSTERRILEYVGTSRKPSAIGGALDRNPDSLKHVLSELTKRELLVLDDAGYSRTPRAEIPLLAAARIGRRSTTRHDFISARSAAGLTQAKLGKLIGVSRTTISRFESGISELGRPKLRKLVRLLNLNDG